MMKCNAVCAVQRGDTSRALPLYERALAIWEATCGGDHPDVAHTLTDIAVIHLEQVCLRCAAMVACDYSYYMKE